VLHRTALAARWDKTAGVNTAIVIIKAHPKWRLSLQAAQSTSAFHAKESMGFEKLSNLAFKALPFIRQVLLKLIPDIAAEMLFSDRDPVH